jgi:hypothetical protein
MSTEPQKCLGKGCDAQGVPQEGFDFFFCQKCCDELERCLHEVTKPPGAANAKPKSSKRPAGGK